MQTIFIFHHHLLDNNFSLHAIQVRFKFKEMRSSYDGRMCAKNTRFRKMDVFHVSCYCWILLPVLLSCLARQTKATVTLVHVNRNMPVCVCNKDFSQRYAEADRVVRAEVVRSVEYESFPNARAYDMLTAEYEFSTLTTYKGGEFDEVKNFSAQGFLDERFCGVKLAITDVRTLFLIDPRKVSIASSWKPGIFLIDSCRVAVDWEPSR